MSDDKKVTSIRISHQLWKDVRKHCIDKDIDIGEYLEELIKRDIKK